ncbi:MULTISPECIES: hypothetical protein [unclassified Bacillus (in: firmicutes)]|uniref:hypothetical protein n=1 Tax=unclassified Bacillus (in: firmicutes) TaxID=185979 RepID=UPI001CB9BB4D|nr:MULTISPECIES: hypothetical protein [unclassified Bacillus (in: firmicutes)]
MSRKEALGLSSADVGVTIYDELFCDEGEIPSQFTGGLTDMSMSPKEAFRIFIRFQLENGEKLAHLNLSSEDIDNFISGVEVDATFYDELENFLKEYIGFYGENYGIEL